MKYLGVLTLVLVASLLISTSQGVNSTFGAVGPYDSLVYREYVVKSPKFLRIVSKDVEYPPRGYRNQKVITAIRAIDQSRNKNGGYATLYRGGPRFRNVTLHLQSFRSQGLNFTVEIYGR